MTIKGMDGQHYDVASSGVGGTGLGLGIAGTALGLLNGMNNCGGGGLLGGLFGGNRNCGGCSENTVVTRYEANMLQELAAKDSKISLLEADKYTDQKISDTYIVLNNKIEGVMAEMRANKDAQNAINMQQAVYNGTNTAALGCIQQQIAALQGLTKVVIPADNVCPQPMPQYNSWTAPTATT